jgi:hypothetical protein
MTVTPRSLFNIILKIFGLFFLREIINQIPDTVMIFVRYFSYDDYEASIGVLMVSILILCFYTFLVLLLLIKTNHIVDLLKLDKGFTEIAFSFEEKQERQISLSPSEILTIAITIIGGYILVQEIPNFCKDAYIFIQERKSIFYGSPEASQSNLLVPASKILIGLLLLGERVRIVNFISKKTAGRNNEDE